MAKNDLSKLEPFELEQSIPGQKLTDKQAAFVKYVSSGLGQSEAAQLAGYTDPGIQAWRLKHLPHVQAAIRAEVAAKLVVEAAPVALAALVEIATDKMAPKGARVQASNSILDRAGFVSKVLEKQKDSENKPLSEMSAAELEAFISGGMQKLDRLRKGGDVVDAEFIETPNQAETPHNAQDADSSDQES